MSNAFDPKQQRLNINDKIISGFERISEVIRILLWDHAKKLKLSPLQIQILIFVNYHESSLNTVSQLSNEFNMKKPTISDAVKALYQKGLVDKQIEMDARGYSLHITDPGRKVITELEPLMDPFKEVLADLSEKERVNLYGALTKLIFRLTENGIIQQQRMCHCCHFYAQRNGEPYCNFLNELLPTEKLHLDCNDFQPAI